MRRRDLTTFPLKDFDMSIIISLDRARKERVTRPVLLSVAKWHDAAQRHDKGRRDEHARMSQELRRLAAQLPVSYPSETQAA
jgi:hypothetical protein